MHRITSELIDYLPREQWRKKWYLNAALGSNGNEGRTFDDPFKTITPAFAKVETLKNDAIILEQSASAISLAETFLWNKSLSGLIGNASGRMYQRSRISQSATDTPMMTISGYGNTFENLYIQHGYAVTDTVGISVEADRNTFRNVHFCPVKELATLDSGYLGVLRITGCEGTYVKGCTFGSHSLSFDEVTPMVNIGPGNGITIFEDCDFFMRTNDTDPYYMLFDNTADTGITLLLNCHFISDVGTALPAVSLKWTGSAGTAYVFIDSRCTFSSTRICAAASDGYVRFGAAFSSTDDNIGGLFVAPDFT